MSDAPQTPMNAVQLPKTLPAKPTGWTKRMMAHFNFGPAGGAASYEVRNPAGEVMPIGFSYDTRKGGVTGFSLPGVQPVMTWDELRQIWPRWLEEQSAKSAKSADSPAPESQSTENAR